MGEGGLEPLSAILPLAGETKFFLPHNGGRVPEWAGEGLGVMIDKLAEKLYGFPLIYMRLHWPECSRFRAVRLGKALPLWHAP